jgi:diketogulonate reductase-like aldo/keto reductase
MRQGAEEAQLWPDVGIRRGAWTGKALKGRKREDVFLATKFGCEIDAHGFHIRGTAKHVRHSINASLERLQTHYVDLYYQVRLWCDPSSWYRSLLRDSSGIGVVGRCGGPRGGQVWNLLNQLLLNQKKM